MTSTTPLSISGREEGGAAISGRGEGTGTATFAGRSEGTGTAARGESRECTGAVPNVQQWLVPTQTRCALGNLAHASLSVMQAGEPLASDGPIMDARASARIKRAVIRPKPAPFCGKNKIAGFACEYPVNNRPASNTVSTPGSTRRGGLRRISPSCRSYCAI